MIHRAKVLTPERAKARTRLPSVWAKAAGLLKGKKKVNALRYQRKLRDQWK